jgi:hypothetical protein
MKYRLIDAGLFLPPKYVLEIETGKCIPMNPDNTDYQRYLKWVSEGNQPLPPTIEPVLNQDL